MLPPAPTRSAAADLVDELPPPVELQRWLTGSAADAIPTLAEGALLLMGGGPDVDDAFRWASERAPGGDAVILRASGADGYNDYLYEDIGGFDSVETLLVTTRALADDRYVAEQVARAELVFIAGGSQAPYVKEWTGTALAAAVREAYRRGAVIGGTSAGAMALGDPVFAAYDGSITSDEALEDPFDPLLTLAPGPFGLLGRTIVDTHFSERERMGRLVAFLARAWDGSPLWGVGLDEEAALVLEDDGETHVFGDGDVHVVYADHAPAPLAAKQPLTYRHLRYGSVLYDAAALEGEVDVVDGALE